MKQKISQITIPDGIDFSDLHLARTPEGSVSFDWSVIERICRANGLPVEALRDTHEDNVAGLLVGWYAQHRRHGGDPDPIAEDLISETVAEESVGQTVSHRPGRG